MSALLDAARRHMPVCFRVPVGTLFRGLVPLLCAGFVAADASAATITVNPGQTIASGIAAAAPGDTVLVNEGLYSGGIIVNRSVAVQAVGTVLLQPPTPATGQAIRIQCSDCSVTGFVFEDFASAFSPDNPTRARVTIKGNVLRRVGNGMWITGDAWLVEGNEIDGLYLSTYAEDYGNVFGTNHTIRHNYFHGLRIPQDLGSPPDYKHNDCLQFWNNNGEVLHNIVIEENIFTDFVQGIFIANETGVLPSMSNIIVRNNVFWGTAFIQDANLQGWPSHGTFFGKAPIPGVIIENNLYRYIGNCISLYTMDSVLADKNILIDAGTTYALADGTLSSAVDRGTAGNILWNDGWKGPLSQGPDKYFNPQLQNPNSLVGPDGIPWTADDGWHTLNPLADGYGPQMTPSGSVPPPPWTDTDGDGFPDIIEIQYGTNPNDPLSFPIIPKLPSVPIEPLAEIALAFALARGAVFAIRHSKKKSAV